MSRISVHGPRTIFTGGWWTSDRGFLNTNILFTGRIMDADFQKEKETQSAGHRARLRAKFRKSGLPGMHDYEMLELLLTYALRVRDVKPEAKRLLEKMGGLSQVLDASVEELCEVKGISSKTALLIKLVKELGTEYLAEKMKELDVLSSPDAVYSFSRSKLSGRDNESFLLIYVNSKNRIIDHEILFEGTVDRSAVYPRRIVKRALERNASGLILVHNHPSGECSPSSQDLKLTRDIKDVATQLDIRVLDHVIVGRGGYFSFQEGALL